MFPFPLPDRPPYLVAFSGGADSRLLLELTVRALLERFGEDGRGLVTAAHLHHGIRGPEADRDENFCREVCSRLGVELICERVNVPALAEAAGESVETAARKARYSFFARVMEERRIPTLLTAHHADDNLETVLERLLRGSGTRGMGGIPACREWALDCGGEACTVCRPLLSRTRADILAACGELGLDYVTDSTNLEADCTRNRLRHTVVPALETIAGAGIPQKAAARLSASAREDEEALTAIAREKYRQCGGYTDSIPIPAITAEMPAIAKRMILSAYRDFLGGDLPADATLSARHLDSLLTLCREGREGDVSDDLPRHARGMIAGGRLVLTRPTPMPSPSLPAEPRPLREGLTVWDEGGEDHPSVTVRIELREAPLPPLTGESVFASAVFPSEKLPLPLYARPRRQGDVILSHGMTKKIKKILCDRDIPLLLRERLPLFLAPDGSPLWYPCAAFRDGYPAPASGSCLRVTVFITTERASHEI